MILPGIDNPDGWLPLVEHCRVAMLTNAAAHASNGARSVDALVSQGARLVQLFSPEHGLGASAAAGESVADDVDAATGVPVCSLYGSRKAIPPELAEGFDVLVVDLPDIGVRYFTYADTLFRVMESCAALHRRVILLDRPPMLGLWRQGTLLDMRFASDVGCAPVPVRHGFSLGGYARWAQANASLAPECTLQVVPWVTQGGSECRAFPDFGLPWVNPSPNLRSFEALCAYPGTCLFEGTNLSEGRGTDAPFLRVGAPFLKADALAEAVDGLPGGRCLLQDFIPTASKFAGQECRGIRLKVTDWQIFNGYEWGLRLLDAARRSAPDDFRFLAPHCDHLFGDDRYRLRNETLDCLLKRASEESRRFDEQFPLT